MNEEIPQKDIADRITSMVENFDEELFLCEEEHLEKYWHFQWNSSQTLEMNTYFFFQCLEQYSKQCKRWEEHTNGHICLIERVREKYILPKINKFLMDIEKYKLKSLYVARNHVTKQ